MHSAIYEGTIRHRRFATSRRDFEHQTAMIYADLDELPSLLGGRLVAPRPGVVRVRRQDYLGDPRLPLDRAVRELVGERTGSVPEGPVRMLAHPRSFGHCFNPVSFYYCFDSAERLSTIVAEVTNTPWGERHAYVLPAGSDSRVPYGEFDKALHVSPFMGMDHRYRWSAPTPAETLSVHIESWREGSVAFDATLRMHRRALNRRSLADVTLRWPAATARMLTLIYGHAIGLKLRGVPVHSHPAPGTA